MNKKIIIFFYLVSLILCKGPYPIENEVLVLNKYSLVYAKKEFKYLLVLFYDQESKSSKDFIPEFEKTASILKKENFVLGKIDKIKGEKHVNHYNIKTFPTIILFNKGEKVIYEGEKKAEVIKDWIIETTKPVFKKITSKTILEKHKKHTKVCLIYYGNDQKVMNKIIVAERKADEDIPFYSVESEDLIKENVNTEKNESIVIYKTFDDKKSVFKDKMTVKNLIKFMNLYASPKVIEFNKETAHIIMEKRNPGLVIFSTKSERHYDDSLNLYNYMWKRIKSKIKLVVVDIKDPAAFKLAEYCNMTEKTIPKVFIIHMDRETPSKFPMSGGINEENMMILIDKWSKGKAKPYIRSEESPKNNTGDLYVLVGKTFEKKVLKNDKDVLIYFYSPTCETCKEYEKKLVKICKELKKHNNKILFAKMDPTVNDVDGYLIQDFPSIKFYRGDAKDKEPLDFDGDRDLDELSEFVKKNAFNKFIEEDKIKKNTDL